MIPSNKIETKDLSPQVFNGVAQEESVQNINTDINSLINTINGLVNTVNTLKSTVDTLASSPSGGGVKKVQRGSTTAAGTITIETVDMSKAVVYSVSKGSAGTVGVSGNINMNAASISASSGVYLDTTKGISGTSPTNKTLSITGTVAAHTGTISGGTTNLTTKQYSAVLTSATTLTCDGPVEWQVIEYL